LAHFLHALETIVIEIADFCQWKRKLEQL